MHPPRAYRKNKRKRKFLEIGHNLRKPQSDITRHALERNLVVAVNAYLLQNVYLLTIDPENMYYHYPKWTMVSLHLTLPVYCRLLHLFNLKFTILIIYILLSSDWWPISTGLKSHNAYKMEFASGYRGN